MPYENGPSILSKPDYITDRCGSMKTPDGIRAGGVREYSKNLFASFIDSL